VGALQSLQGNAEIPGCGSNVGVTEQNLDRPEVGAGVEHVGGAGVAEQVRMDQNFEASPPSRFAAKQAKGTVIEWLIGVLFGG